MYSNLRSKILCPHYKLHLIMQIIFQNLIIRWQPYPSWKQRTWSSCWCSALRALLFGLILAEMDALSALAGKDFCRSSCTITEPVCQHNPKWGWQLCVPGVPDLAEASLLRLSWVLGEAWPPPARPALILCSAERSPGWEHLCWTHTDTGAAARGGWSWFIACLRDFTGAAPAFSQGCTDANQALMLSKCTLPASTSAWFN